MSGLRPALSIVIPVHDWPVGALVRALLAQIVALDAQERVDIHLFDDASAPAFASELRAQREAAAAAGVTLRLQRTDRNVGRSVARNELLAAAAGHSLLFLDADVLPDEADFLARYLAAAAAGDEVVCGGISYRQCGAVRPEHRFYWRYSSAASVADPALRQQRPWAWIFTANMLVSRRVVQAVPFDDGFVGYGYEDIEWGIRLDRLAGIRHLDNTVTHLGLLTKPVLQRKTREAAPNLVHMYGLHREVVAGMQLARLALGLARWPTGLLARLADLAGHLFLVDALGYRVALLAFQSEKILRAALAFRRADGAAR